MLNYWWDNNSKKLTKKKDGNSLGVYINILKRNRFHTQLFKLNFNSVTVNCINVIIYTYAYRRRRVILHKRNKKNKKKTIYNQN